MTAEAEHNTPPLYWPNIGEPFSHRWELWSHWSGLLISIVGLISGFVFSPSFFVLSPAFIIGACIGLSLEKKRMRSNLLHIEQQISSRDDIPQNIWGDNPQRIAMSKRLLDNVRISWKTRRFIPEDPLWLVVYGHTYLVSEEAEMQDVAEKLINKYLTDEEVEGLVKGSLGDAVDFFLCNKKEITNTSSGSCPIGCSADK